jgi:hypothetical protein
MKCVSHLALKQEVFRKKILLTYTVHYNAYFIIKLHYLLTPPLLKRLNKKQTRQ